MEPQYLIFGGAGLISLLAFAALILVPAIGSFGRGWEKATAALLSLIVLVATVAAVMAESRLAAILSLGVVGVVIVLIFLL